MINNFVISERDLCYPSDNLINYNAGPIKIKICGHTQTITFSTNNYWKKLLPQCVEMAKEAWELNDNDIIESTDTKTVYKYNFKNIQLYIEYSIIFL